MYRGRKRVGLLTRRWEQSAFFCRRGIFWRLCDISPPLLAFDFSVERRRGDPARFWYRRRVHARRVQTSAVNPRSDADARNRAKGRTEGGDQDAPTGGATRLVKGKNALQLQRGARDTTSRVSHLLGEHVRGGRQRGISVAHALLVQGRALQRPPGVPRVSLPSAPMSPLDFSCLRKRLFPAAPSRRR